MPYKGSVKSGNWSDPDVWTNAARFDGSHGLQSGANADWAIGAGGITVACWFNVDALSNTQVFMAHGNPEVGLYEWCLGLLNSGTTFAFRVYDGTNQRDAFVSATGLAGGWHLLVGWYDPATKAPYVRLDNGATVGGGALPGTPNVRTDPLTLGMAPATSTTRYWLTGSLDSVGVWNRVLSAAERDELWNSGQGKSFVDLSAGIKSGLRAWYDLCETSGNRLDQAFPADSTKSLVEQGGSLGGVAGWAGTRVPGSNDNVKVYQGHEIICDVDLRNGTGLVALTLDGTIKVPNSIAPGNYAIKMAGGVGNDIAGTSGGTTGKLQVGDSAESPLPHDRTFTLDMGANSKFYMSYAPNCLLYGQVPAEEYVSFNIAPSSGDTVLHVDRDVTADPCWKVGAIVCIARPYKGVVAAYNHAIKAVTPTTIELTTPLTASMEIGTRVYLVSRNVEVTLSGTQTLFDAGNRFNVRNGRFKCAFRQTGAMNRGAGFTSLAGCSLLPGSVAHGLAQLMNNYCVGWDMDVLLLYCSVNVIGGIGNSGRVRAAGVAFPLVAQGSIIDLQAFGCTYGAYACQGTHLTGEIQWCGTGLMNWCGIAHDVYIHDCTNDASGADSFADSDNYRLRMVDAVQFNSNVIPVKASSLQFVNWDPRDANGVVQAGQVKGWMPGGSVASSPEIPSPDPDIAMVHSLYFATAAQPTWLDFPIRFEAGYGKQITVWLRKDRTAMTDTLRAQLVDPSQVWNTPAEILLEEVCPDDLDTWHKFVMTYTSPVAAELAVRFRGTNADGRGLFAFKVEEIVRQTDIDAIATAAAAAVLANPANRLATDATGKVALQAVEHTAVQADADAALQAKGYTEARAAKLDNLDDAITSRQASGVAVTLPDPVPAGYGGVGTGLSEAQAASLAAIQAQTDKLGTGAASVIASPITDGGAITCYAGAALKVPKGSLTIPAGYTKLWFTAKMVSRFDADAAAIAQIEETAGLLILNGAPAATPTQGSLTVDQPGGSVNIYLAAEATVMLYECSGMYDLKCTDSAGDEVELARGTFAVTRAVTLATA